jgi:hypothetical protein
MRPSSWFATLVLVAGPAAGQVQVTSAPDLVALRSDRVEVRLERGADGWRASFHARGADGAFRRVASLADTPAGPRGVALSARRPGLLHRDAAVHGPIFREARADGPDAVVLEGAAAGHRIALRFRAVPGEPRVRVELVDRLPPGGPVAVEYLLFPLLFEPDGAPLSKYGALDFAWLPNLRPEEGQVAADHVFRAPAAIAQKGAFLAALVPDVVAIGRDRAMPLVLDLDLASGLADAPLMAYGFAEWRAEGHSYFRHDPGAARTIAEPELRLAFDLFLRADAPANGFGEIVRFQWERYGRAWLDRGLPQTIPFGEYGRRYSYPAALGPPPVSRGGDGWWEQEIDGVTLGGVIGGWHMGRGYIPNQAWFLNQRSAWGMAYFAKAWGDRELLRKARAMKELALTAPRREGMFPAVFDSKRKEWVGTLVAPEGGHYHVPDAAWKGLWLLRWHRDVEPDGRILETCRALGDFLIRRQEPSGAIPTWFTEALEPHEALRESAGTGMAVWFLAELFALGADPRFLAAARKGGEFLAREVAPTGRWFDFETFYSCSPKPLDFADRHTGIPPQNTLAMQWTAEAFAALGRSTGEMRWHEAAAPVVDLLCLYQAIWPISFRRVAYTYGGFGVQNTDAEYNDARQSQFANTLIDLGRAAGRRDWVERGVAALRAGFALIHTPENRENGVYPDPNQPLGLSPENCGHGSGDTHDGRTGFDWGEGSALAGAAWALRHHGGALLDVAAGSGVGIDGVRFADVRAKGDVLSFWLLSPLLSMKGKHEPWPVEVRFAGVGRDALRVTANGKDLGRLPAGKLEAGIEVRPAPDFRLVVSEAVERDGTLRLAAEAEGPWAPDAVLLHWRRDGGSGRVERAEGRGRGPWSFAIPLDTLEPVSWWLEAQAGAVRFTSPDVFPDEAPHRFRPGVVFDFEQETLAGWEASGSLGPLPTASDRKDFGKAGLRFLGTSEDGKGGFDDGYQGELRSPPFTVRHPRLSLLVGGGRRPKSCYVALVRADTGQELFRETGGDDERMTRRAWDARALVGTRVRLVVVDRSAGGWGHVNVDDVRFE